MSKLNIANLNEREREWLEHVRQARERGVSFAEYCRRAGLSASLWYRVRRGLVQKGVLGMEEEKPAGFAPVRVMGSARAAPVACRLRHPSGWTIECEGTPEVSWVRALMAGVAA
jgi:hypothetical protein